jgi:hypothetical protein
MHTLFKQLLDGLKENRGYSKLKREALDRTVGEFYLEEPMDLCKTDYRMNG